MLLSVSEQLHRGAQNSVWQKNCMIDLGSTDFYIGVPSLPRDEIEAYSSRLFDIWDTHVGAELGLDDYSLALEIEEGSIKGSGKLGATVAALYLGVCGYGSLVQGIQTIRSHVIAAGNYLAETAHSSLGPNKPSPSVRRRSGELGRLQRLFYRVQRREITVDEAMQQAEIIIGSDAPTAPEFLKSLNDSLRNTPLIPDQLSLALEEFEEEPIPEEKNQNQAPRLPRPKEALPPANQFRVEIWRESKKGNKTVRVIEL